MAQQKTRESLEKGLVIKLGKQEQGIEYQKCEFKKKEQNTWMHRMQRFFTIKIQRNFEEDSEEYYYFNIPENVQEDSKECSKRFQGRFEKIPGNFRKDPQECSIRFWRMFEKTLENVSEDSRECCSLCELEVTTQFSIENCK